MLLFEFEDTAETIIRGFVRYASRRLSMAKTPKVKIVRDAAYSSSKKTFGHFTPGAAEILVQIENRHILDILRTLAHELVHARQDELGELHPGSGDTGSDQENQANSLAGVIMRDFNQAHPELFSRAAE